ncbi:hypothetical protein EDC96DRAFT_550081 [Choanephora cucurbitarum]|nr:hypothetical protein EDC96DRAFT_550081 [Choanephora cucurbitarum]
MAVQRGLSFANNDDLPVISSAYEEIVRDPSLLQALIDQRDAYNSEAKDSVTMKNVILEKSLGQLKKYCDWLHSEFDVHLVYVFAIDFIRVNSSADFVYNSSFEFRCLPSASSIPVSASFVLVFASSAPVSVLPTETEHTYKEKRKVLVKAIREIVHRLLNEADCRTHRLVPRGDLLSGEAGRLQLRNWPRYDNDTSKKGKYQLQNLSVSQLQDIKDKPDMNIIFINAESSLVQVADRYRSVLLLACVSRHREPLLPDGYL